MTPTLAGRSATILTILIFNFSNMMAKITPNTGVEDSKEHGYRHYLDRINDKSFFAKRNIEKENDKNKVYDVVKEILYSTVSIMDIKDIDTCHESFSVKFRLYTMYKLDLLKLGLNDLHKKTSDSECFYKLLPSEISQLNEAARIPIVSVFNIISLEETDDADMRAYISEDGETYVLWNKLYDVTCRERFEVEDFPYDNQDLQIELRLNDPLTWNEYDLTVHMVQFHKNAIRLTEWVQNCPQIFRNSPAHKSTTISLQVLRKARYYIQNIVVIMYLLSLSGLLAFSMTIDDVSGRVGNSLTLILTAVAFKFVLQTSLPIVPYNTLLDYFIMWSTYCLFFVAMVSVIPYNWFDNEQRQITANYALGWISACLCVLFAFVWSIMAYKRIQKGKPNPIEEVEGKNWYTFDFSVTPFM